MTAKELGIPKEEVIVVSTGVIGEKLAVEPFAAGIPPWQRAFQGSGMIYPNMATALNFITSDVSISRETPLPGRGAVT